MVRPQNAYTAPYGYPPIPVFDDGLPLTPVDALDSAGDPMTTVSPEAATVPPNKLPFAGLEACTRKRCDHAFPLRVKTYAAPDALSRYRSISGTEFSPAEPTMRASAPKATAEPKRA